MVGTSNRSEGRSAIVGGAVEQQPDGLAALLMLARGHAVFCRRDIARVAFGLRLEFSGQDHPVGHKVEKSYALFVEECATLIRSARRANQIPDGPPAELLGQAVVGALEGTVIAMAGRADHDELFAERAVRGILGLPTTAAP